MKVKHNYKQPVICVMILTLLGATSCKKSFYSDVNVNPNAPSSASIVPGVLLPPIESSIGYLQGGDLSRFACLNIQQVKGLGNQADGFYKYIYISQDFDNVWGNIYSAVLENDDVLLQMSEAKGFHAYAGVARILRAYILQVTVDQWGSVPYTQALKGAANLKPAFDNDKILYDTIGKLLDEGIVNLNNTDAGALVPGDEDAMYGGDPDKWIKFAHAIKARLYMHQSKGDAAMAANALTEMALSFTANEDNARYVFGSTETSANPWYQFNQQRSGQIGFSSGKVAKMMIALHDPRLPILIDTSKKDALLYYGVTDAPVEFITYDELLFATAEAVLRNGGTIVAAQAFFRAAITANMSKLGVKDADITAYVAANGNLPPGVDDAIATISTQEYLALYLNPEAWTLWRRTNSPALTPIAGTSIPRRLLYPQTEYSYNKANVPASVTLFSPKVFWDK
jgi:hypothetical protein